MRCRVDFHRLGLCPLGEVRGGDYNINHSFWGIRMDFSNIINPPFLKKYKRKWHMEWHLHSDTNPIIPLTSVITLYILMWILEQSRPKISYSKSLLAGKLAKKCPPHALSWHVARMEDTSTFDTDLLNNPSVPLLKFLWPTTAKCLLLTLIFLISSFVHFLATDEWSKFHNAWIPIPLGCDHKEIVIYQPIIHWTIPYLLW